MNPYESYAVKKYRDKSPIASKIIAMSGLSRINADNNLNKQDVIYDLASTVIAPLLVSYVTWVLEEAKTSSIARLYFVSRDGYILREIAERLIDEENGPELAYLYGSRQAWHMPAVEKFDRFELDWLLQPHDSWTLRDIFRRLSVDIHDISHLIGVHGFNERNYDKELSRNNIDGIWRILEDREIRRYLMDQASKRRLMEIEYFKQEGLFSVADKWALVDTGWRLTSQRSLKKILEYGGYHGTVRGYYLGLRADHVTGEIGEYRAFVSQKGNLPGLGMKSRWLFEQGVASVIETVFTGASHPLVVGYKKNEGKVIPEFSGGMCGNLPDKDREIIRDVILRYAECVKNNNLCKTHAKLFYEIGLNLAARFFKSPQRDYVRRISDLLVDIEQSHERKSTRKLASELTMRDISNMVAYILFDHGSRYSDPLHAWYGGSASLSKPWTRHLYHALAFIRYQLKLLNTL
jgi:predicted HAD superfamily hydrolase